VAPPTYSQAVPPGCLQGAAVAPLVSAMSAVGTKRPLAAVGAAVASAPKRRADDGAVQYIS